MQTGELPALHPSQILDLHITPDYDPKGSGANNRVDSPQGDVPNKLPAFDFFDTKAKAAGILVTTPRSKHVHRRSVW